MNKNIISLLDAFPTINESLMSSVKSLIDYRNSAYEDCDKEKQEMESVFEKIRSILKSFSPFPELENNFYLDIKQSNFWDRGALSKECYEFKLDITDPTAKIMWSSTGLRLTFKIHVIDGALSYHKLCVNYGSGGYGEATNESEAIISKFMMNSFTIQHTFIERLKSEVFSETKETSYLKQLMLYAIDSCKQQFEKNQKFDADYSASISSIEKTLYSQLTPVSKEQIASFISRENCELTCAVPVFSRQGDKLAFQINTCTFGVNKTGKASYKKDVKTKGEHTLTKEKIEDYLSKKCYIIDDSLSRILGGLDEVTIEIPLV